MIGRIFLLAAAMWVSASASAVAEIRMVGEQWGQPTAPVPGWSEAPGDACEFLGLTVVPGLYYDGEFYEANYEGQTVFQRQCVDKYGKTSWVQLYCAYQDDEKPENNDADPDNDSFIRVVGACPREQLICKVDEGGETPLYGQSRPGAGNPIELASRVKTQSEIDWRSSMEPRFHISRDYRSNFDLYHDFNPNLSRLAFAGVWRSEFNDIFRYNHLLNIHILLRSDGTRLYFENDGSYTPRSVGNNLAVTYVDNGYYNKRLIVEDGSGVVRQYDAQDVFDRPLSEIIWPDGYTISVSRSNGLITVVSDNRGNRAEFTWSSTAVPNTSRELLTSIAIDTDYASNFNPELRVNYTYLRNLQYPDYPPLSTVTLEDLAQQTIQLRASYRYQEIPDLTGVFEEHYMFPLLLTSIADGRSGGTGFAEFSYDLGELTSNLPIFRRDEIYTPRPAISTQHADGADAFTVDATGFTWPSGREEDHQFSSVGARSVTTRVDGVLTPNCLATTALYSYVPPPGQPEGFLYERTERNGSVTRFTRDAEGRILTRTEDADGLLPRVTTYTWHADLRKPLTRTTDELAETFVYDPDGMLTSYTQTDVLVSSPSNGQSRTWAFTYTTLASGLKVLAAMDGPGLASQGVQDVTSYTYDAQGRMTGITNPDGSTVQIQSFSSGGQPASLTDARGFDWTFTYDIDGRVIQSVFEPGARNDTWAMTYDEVGQLISIVDPLGRQWSYVYNSARRLTSLTDPAGNTMDFEYDVAGNVTRTEYGNALATVTYLQEAQYDELGRLLAILGSNGQVTRFTHDVEDNVAQVEDGLGLTDSFTYDALKRLTAELDRENFTTSMDHDPSGDLTRYTDPRGIETLFTYNGFGEVITEVSADRGTHSYSYDSRGLVTSYTDGRGQVSTYSYDSAGRLVSRQFVGDATQNLDFVYFGATGDARQHQLRFVDDKTGRYFYYYDVQTGDPNGHRATIDGVTYRADLDHIDSGQPHRLIYPSLSALIYAYDQNGNIEKLIWRGYDTTTGGYFPSETAISNMTYLPFGPLASATTGDGGSYSASYDSSYRLTGQLDQVNGSTVRNMAYTWTIRDNLAGVTDLLSPANDQTFAYTDREFLAAADGPWGEFDYNYDGVGNRTSLTALIGGITATETFSYPIESNRLSSISFPVGSRGLVYDAAGNVVQDTLNGQIYSYTYDAANRMSSFAIDGVVQAEYEYNHLGQQAVRHFPQTGETIHSVFDHNGNRIAEYLFNSTSGTSALIREYIWAGSMLVAVWENNQLYFVRSDHIGRPVLATDNTGTVVWTASYGPFGEVVASSGPNIDLRFPGQWFQAETGLHQNWMRDYDPTTGRYMQADPLGLVDGASVYGYARQNPGRYVDPTGQCPWCVAAALGFAFGAGVDFLLQMWENDFRISCINWWQVGLSGGIGAITGGGVGQSFKFFGSTGNSVAPRFTYSLYRRFTKRYGFRIESHPIRKWWPNWAYYPHWHIDRFRKWHLPLVEPIVSGTVFLSHEPNPCCN
ncbi:RHS repeat protein [Loktanella sp. IMCC34160]|uniref:RHS repeat domain-containing protein n=1 Tax=Loktanella sp. IMCC34160 TaxID=2510646 RepID=UPI00101BA8E2|nr:RHS repeat-associated core domain-containing protein [Loktanella sp. IMCC34160]RYG90076.1 RHS repeat protein [Loktanella sp. IMCC34160]